MTIQLHTFFPPLIKGGSRVVTTVFCRWTAWFPLAETLRITAKRSGLRKFPS